MNFIIGLIVVGISGFIALSYEILWYSAYSIMSKNAPVTFGILLGFYLLGIAIGSFLCLLICRDNVHRGNFKILRALSLFLLVSNILCFFVLILISWFATFASWWQTLPIVALSTALMGATLPLISHFGIAPNQLAGSRLSYLYFSNIIGSTAGSLITGFILLDVWPIRTIAIFLFLLGLLLSAVLLLVSHFRKTVLILSLSGILCVSVLGVIFNPYLFDQFYEKLLFKQDYESGTRFKHIVENKNGLVTVTDDGVVYGSGSYDGRISTSLLNDRNGIVRAYSIPAFHPNPRNILMIGVGSGSWAKVLSQIPELEKLTIIEINPGYFEMITKEPIISSILNNPRVEIIINDGRRWLKNHPNEKFDIIVSNTTWNFRAYATQVLSYEFQQLVKHHLEPGGMLFINTTGSKNVMITAFEVFEYGYRYFNLAVVSDYPFNFDNNRWEHILTNYTIDGKPILDLSRQSDLERYQERKSTKY